MDTNTTHWTEAEVLHHPSEACRALNHLADINADLLEALEAMRGVNMPPAGMPGHIDYGVACMMADKALLNAKGET